MANCARSLRSPAWDHFEKTTNKKVECKVCKTVLAYHGGTSSMKSHLLSRHPDLCSSSSSDSKSSATMDNFLAPKKCSTARSKEITRRIAEMVARDLRPIRMVACDGFKNLMSYVEPGYTVPSHTHIATVCHRLYDTEKEQLLTLIANSVSVGLTTDIWTSAAIHAYMTVTVHIIDDEWQLQSKVLVTKEMPERHTGQHIADKLLKIADDWHLLSGNKIAACVRDNAANAISGLRLTGWDHFGCAAHSLQLCVNAGLEVSAISQMVAFSRKIIGHFKHSVVAMTGLREKQTQLNVPDHQLVQDVSTRWNSTYYMLERLAEQRVAIYAVIHDPSFTKPEHRYLDLKDTQWELLSQVVTVLKPLQIATTVLSSDTNVSCSVIYPVINGLLSHHLVVSNDDLSSVKRFKQIVTEELEKRFIPSTDSLPLRCAAVDPRYSHLRFTDDSLRKQIREELEDEISGISIDTNTASETDEEEEPPAKKTKTGDSAMRFLLGLSSDNSHSTSMTSHQEMQHFINEPPLNPDGNPLEWWRKNEERFPRLSKIARKLMCVPATSVPAERVFSTSGMIVNKLRASLKPENVDMLVFLNKNLPPI